jgi:hypothetical protein
MEKGTEEQKGTEHFRAERLSLRSHPGRWTLLFCESKNLPTNRAGHSGGPRAIQ